MPASHLLWAGLLLASALACRGSERQPDAAALVSARREFEARGREDQAVREGFGIGGVLDTVRIKAMMRTDSANSAWLEGYVATQGWPTVGQVGREAVQAAFLIVQHATHDTGFMRAMLPHIEGAYQRGDLSGDAVAMLTDRLAVHSGHPQIYGTQASFHDGRWTLDPITDSAHVDERRQRLGLPPLATYLRVLDSVYNGPRQP